MKKNIIWDNSDINYDDWKEGWKEYLEDNNLTEEECDLYEWVGETLSIYLDDERTNLNEEVDGVIVAFADLGLWDGRYKGAGIVGTNVRDILYDTNCDYSCWYCDRYNVRFDGAHHDGRNHYLYRVAKDKDTAERLANKIAYEDMSEDKFRKATKSLRPYVAKIYGLK